jgi:5-formyltetrahydrofolate cyclo-ligase
MQSIGALEWLILAGLALALFKPEQAGKYYKKWRHVRNAFLSWQSKLEQSLDSLDTSDTLETSSTPSPEVLFIPPHLQNHLKQSKPMPHEHYKKECQIIRQQIKKHFTTQEHQTTLEVKQGFHAQIVQNWDILASYTTLCAYYPIARQEPDLTLFLQNWLHSNKHLYLPYIPDTALAKTPGVAKDSAHQRHVNRENHLENQGKNQIEDAGTMYMKKIMNLQSDMQSGPFGIMAPKAHLPNLNTNPQHKHNKLNNNDNKIAIFVPGLAFGLHGERIGRGKGFYDRFLAKHPQALKIGVCFESQLFTEAPIPQIEHDVPMHFIVTESRIYNTGNSA